MTFGSNCGPKGPSAPAPTARFGKLEDYWVHLRTPKYDAERTDETCAVVVGGGNFVFAHGTTSLAETLGKLESKPHIANVTSPMSAFHYFRLPTS